MDIGRELVVEASCSLPPKRVRAAIRYPGAKAEIAPWIVSNFPSHTFYLEPFFGSGAVLLAKPRVKYETVNDLDDRVVNLFRVLRDSPAELIRAVALTPYARAEYEASVDESGDVGPVEAARRFVVRSWQAQAGRTNYASGRKSGWWHHVKAERYVTQADIWDRVPDRLAAMADRLRGVQIERKPAIDVIARAPRPDLLIYADPPYPLAVRAGSYYQHEMSDEDHIALLGALNAHPGPVVLSGYRCSLYDELLVGWVRVDRKARAEKGKSRTESLWVKSAAAPAPTGEPDLEVSAEEDPDGE